MVLHLVDRTFAFNASHWYTTCTYTSNVRQASPTEIEDGSYYLGGTLN